MQSDRVPFVTCNLAQPGCTISYDQERVGGFLSWGHIDNTSMTSENWQNERYFGSEINKLTTYLLSQTLNM